ncbi:MAG: hypothetical protein E7678_02765 [Ruminococcaceae bacterium]|nr:hypothetical protein [Oscillospiraceae bacterium]
MKNSRRFLERMNEINDEFLMRAEDAVENKKRRSYIKWVIIAAAVCAIAAISLTVMILNSKEDSNSDSDDVLEVPISDVYWVDTRERNNLQAQQEQSAIVWPWNCRAIYSQYTEITLNGSKYRSRSSYYGGEIFANQIGEKICKTEAKGYDEHSSFVNHKDVYYTMQSEVFEIVGVDSRRIVAVKYDGYDGYYAFLNDTYQVPSTFGELIEALDLTNNIKLNSFYYDFNGDRKDEHYALNNEKSAELWKILQRYEKAPAVAENVSAWSENRISFSLNSNTLGVYNLSFTFKEDGHLVTNIENYGYTYNLGKDAVKEIVDFAVENRLAITLPEKQYLVGTVTEIGEDYIKVDDSVVMKNSNDGIEFTVYATNMNIRRYIISGYLKVGDTVSVEHGYLLKENYTEIKNAVDLNECIITSNGNVLIPE